MQHKTHHTAVVALPPPEIWEPIQVIRRQHDRQLQRWMPHINLLYPFVAREHFAMVRPLLTAASRQVTPFQVTLAIFRSFTHAFGGSTLWLEPEPRDAFTRLQATLQAAFPSCDDLSRFPGGFTPHLSVGQVGSLQALRHVRSELQSTWQPLQFTLSTIALIWREADGPFQIDGWIPLAS
jgi:2'-5' RNA ligase